MSDDPIKTIADYANAAILVLVVVIVLVLSYNTLTSEYQKKKDAEPKEVIIQ